MKYFDAFTGIGGFTKAIEDTIPDAKCVGYSEVDKYAIQIYETHYPTHKNYGDIRTIDTAILPDFDLFVGGFPCQAFSVAGKRRGFDDTRGTLFFEIARIIKDKRPAYLLLENVKGLLSHDNGRTFQKIMWTLDELGYDCQWQVLNSKNFGVPQNRERVFIIGHFRGKPRPEIFFITKNGEVSCDPTRQISPTITSRYYKQAQSDPYISRYPLKFLQRNQKNIKGDYAFTVDGANTVRRLTPTECCRLQGFPDSWVDGISDTQKYKCLGNAVTVNVVAEIIKRLC